MAVSSNQSTQRAARKAPRTQGHVPLTAHPQGRNLQSCAPGRLFAGDRSVSSSGRTPASRWALNTRPVFFLTGETPYVLLELSQNVRKFLMMIMNMSIVIIREGPGPLPYTKRAADSGLRGGPKAFRSCADAGGPCCLRWAGFPATPFCTRPRTILPLTSKHSDKCIFVSQGQSLQQALDSSGGGKKYVRGTGW